MATTSGVRRRPQNSRRRRISPTRTLVVVLLVAWALLEVLPILFMFNTSLKTDGDILASPFSPAWPPVIDNYVQVWNGEQTGQGFPGYFLNSATILIGTIGLLLVVSSMAGYALARGRFPGSPIVQSSVLLALAVPAHTLLIPLFFLLGDMGLRNSAVGMILILTTLGLPLSVVLARAYFVSFPVALEEAARIDGCTRFGAFIRIVIPMSKGVLATIAIVNLTWVWSELFFASAFLADIDSQTLPVAISAYRPGSLSGGGAIGQHVALMALTTLPLLILYLVFQRDIRKGMAAGALR